MTQPSGEAAVAPLLLTPGPLTTDARVRWAMTRDWGSRDPAFVALTAELRSRLLAVANAGEAYVAVPLQGSGTFVVEAALSTLIKPSDKLLVLVNGAYGRRMVEICRRLGRRTIVLEWLEDQAVDAGELRAALVGDREISHVAVVHCETTTGLLNPLPAVAQVVAESGRALLVDAMSSFGALELDLGATPVAAVMASSNKGLEGTPGLGFALVDRDALNRSAQVSPSLSLDLYEQWRGFETNGQWRFTPPVQVVAALVEALRLLEAEGGPAVRRRRYAENLRVLVEGLESLGFDLYLDRALQAPVIATFRSTPGFDFETFYMALAERGFVIYPGKLTRTETFRIGCIGAVTPADMARLVTVVREITGMSGQH